MRSMKYSALMSASAVALSLISTSAFAQADEEYGEITVTARKRSETVNDIPISITAISADDIEKQSIRSIRDLANNTPGLSLTMGGTPSSTNLVVRGLASSNFNTSLNVENNVGVFIDGIYQTSRNTLDVLEVMDIGQITLAKGPQSALYGRSTFAGALGIATKEPTSTPSYSMSGTLGSDKDRRISGTISGPIVEGLLSGSLKATYVTFDGTVPNSEGDNLGGYTRQGLSGSLKLTPVEGLSFKATGLLAKSSAEMTGGYLIPYGQQNCGAINAATGARMLYCGEVKARKSADMSGNIPNSEGLTKQVALESRYENDAFTVVAVTGLTRANFSAYFDYDATSAGDVYGVCTVVGASCPTVGGLASYNRTIVAQSVGANKTRVRTFNQELRVQSPDANRLQWLVGGLYFDSKVKEEALTGLGAPTLSANERLVQVLPAYAGTNTGPLAAFGNPAITPDEIDLIRLTNLTYMGTKTYSIFGGLSYKVIDSLKVSAEGRYNIDKKFNNSILSFYAPGTGLQEGTFKSFTPRFTIEFEPARDFLTYVNAAKGVRSGGFNGVAGILPTEANYEEESNWTYEVGVKGELLDRRLRFALAAYKVDWSNIQVPSYSENGAVIQTIIRNLGSLDAKGVDFDADFRANHNISFGGSLSYSQPKYGKGVYDPSQVTQCGGTATCNYVAVDGRGLQPSIAGNRAPRSVGWQWNLHSDVSGDLTADWKWTGRVDVNHVGKQYINAMNLSYYGRRTLANLRIGVQGPVFGVSAFVTNLFDKNYVSTALTQPRNAYPSTLRTVEAYMGEGRRGGVTVTAAF